MHNVIGDNAGSQWFNMIDKVLSGTAKANRVPSGMDNDHNVGMEDQTPSQHEEVIHEVPHEEPESLRTRAFNFLGVRGQPVKRRKLGSDMAAFLDCFCESNCRIKELKLEAAIKLHEDNRKFELKIFKLIQASQERMANFLPMFFKA